MKTLKLILLASTCLVATAPLLRAEPAPLVLAQAAPDQRPEGAPKAPPPAAPKAAPPQHPVAPPPAAPRPPAPPAVPHAEPPHANPPPQVRTPPAPRAPDAAPPPHAAPPANTPSPRGEPPHREQPAQAPAQRSEPPAQRNDAPQRRNEAPAPRTEPPAQRNEAPAPRNEPPAQRGEPAPQQRTPNAAPTPPAPRDAAPPRPNAAPNAVQTPPGGQPLPGAAPNAPAAQPGAPSGPGGQRSERRGPPPGLPAGTPAAPAAAPVAAPLPAPPAQATTPIPANSNANRGNIDSFRSQRQQTTEGGRTVIRESDRVIVQDPNGQSFIRHNEVDRFRYGARDVQSQRFGNNDTRTIIVRPDGSQIITEVGPDGGLLRRLRRDRDGREIVIIDNPRRGPSAGFFVALPPPVLRIPQDRYIVEAEGAPPELIYDTLEAPPVDRIERAYSLDEIRYSPSVRQRMPSIDLDSINFETGSWDISQDQAAKLQVIADGLNRAIQRNPREVFLIEGHTDAVGSDVDNLSLSDRRAQSAAELLTQQFGVPAENLTSQGYGEQYLKEQTEGPSRINRRVTVRRITPLLTGQNQPLPPPPPGVGPGGR